MDAAIAAGQNHITVAVQDGTYTSDHIDCSVCEYLMGKYAGKLLVRIPATEELAEWEGKEIVVLTCRNSMIRAVRATVIDGFITFFTENLGSFLFLVIPISWN